jgi:hypothetical protein
MDVLGGFVGAVQARIDTGVRGAALGLYLVQLGVPVLGAHHGPGAHAQAIAFPGDSELDGRRAVRSERIKAQLAGNFHRAAKLRQLC